MSQFFKTTVLVSVGNEDSTIDDVKKFLEEYLIVDVDLEDSDNEIGFECIEVLTDNLEEAVVADMYENQQCPDCEEKIPLFAKEGEACKNCGFVFSFPKPTDDGSEDWDDWEDPENLDDED